MTESDKSNMLSASAWMIGMRWIMRTIGLVSMMLLARLLVPEDFGIIAMAMIVVGLFEVVSFTGVDLALIRDTEATKDHYDSAWTIQIIQGFILAGLLLLAAPFVPDYFHEPRAELVIQFLALRGVIEGFENIGVVAFRKELDFAKEFRFGVYKKGLGFCVLISSALILQNYWAMVFGLIFGTILNVILSFKMHPYRPRISFSKVKDIWMFSQWLLISRVGYYLNKKTDQLAIGGVSGTSQMGEYHVGFEVATMPSAEIIMPVRRAMFPAYSKIQHESDRFSTAILESLGIVAILVLALGVGMFTVAEDFVAVVLGSKWQDAVPIIKWLALFGVAWGLSATLENVLLVTGRTKLSALEAWLQLLVLVPCLLYAAQNSNDQVVAIAFARTAVAFLFLPLMLCLVSWVSSVSIRRMVDVLWRPCISAVIMSFGVEFFHLESVSIPIATLILDIFVGGVLFSLTLFGLWAISGYPKTAENHVFGSLTILLNKIRSFS